MKPSRDQHRLALQLQILTLDRQIVIGFGCMLELLRQAAAELGYRAEVLPFPDGEDSPRLKSGRIAQVRFVATELSRDPLFGSIIARRSTKEPFLDQALAPTDIKALARAIPGGIGFGHSKSTDEHQALTGIAWQAWQIEQATPATRRESIDLMRFGNAAIVAQPDGIDMGGFLLGAGHAAGIITPSTLDTLGSTAYNQAVEMYRSMAMATPT